MGPVTERITLYLLTPEGTAAALETEWHYRPDDPYAVRLEFGPETAGACWVLSREMLVAALSCPVGEGDIQLAPTEDGLLCLALGSRAGVVLLSTEAAPVEQFLNATAELVPFGTESERIDWDGGLAALLSA
ncbi:SsgA family sporulation/cell division regulator [Kitasatospora sp. NPDC088134]|uniref:SsgA family sporulation/cell division regulator n=1 Tax=Kitasatospora sp. NPDC088134 TaxID=3364071 RepID=UPI0037F4842F